MGDCPKFGRILFSTSFIQPLSSLSSYTFHIFSGVCKRPALLFNSQQFILWRQLPVLPQTFIHTDRQTCVICPVALKTTPALLACDRLWFSDGMEKGSIESNREGNFCCWKYFSCFCFVFCLLFCHLLRDSYWSSLHWEKVGTTETVCSRRHFMMWQTKCETHTQKKPKGGSMQIWDWFCQIL